MASVAIAAGIAEANASPSVSLARRMKIYGNIKYQPNITYSRGLTTTRGVLEYKSDIFFKYCHPASPSYDASIDFDEVARELFKQGEVWASRDNHVFRAVEDLSALHGFYPKKEKETISCNREGKSDDASRNFIAGQLGGDCPFHLTLKPLSKQSYKATEAASKWSYRKLWDGPVQIASCNCEHGGLCRPSRQNRAMTASRAGKYIEKMPDVALFSLCNYLESRGKLPSSLIKSIMEPVWPTASKNISKHDVFNIRVKIMRLMPTFRKTNQDYEEFKRVANANDMLKGIENTSSLDDDEAYELAQSLWLEMAASANDREDAIFSFIEYLELIKSRAKGFVYELARDTSDDPNRKKLLGVIWQTATMRRNFELFGEYISLDMMKRALNILLWPYTAVCMYDDARKLCLGCEGVLCGERVDMYAFMCKFLGKNSPGRLLSEVKIVSGDGFFDTDTIRKLGFTNANFILDQWHFINSGVEKMFGSRGYETLKEYLIPMIRAADELTFDSLHKAAVSLLESLPRRNGEWENTLRAFVSNRETFASYCIARIPGNRGNHGSASAEQNNASLLCHLNDGNKHGNEFNHQHLNTFMRETLIRQKKQVSTFPRMLCVHIAFIYVGSRARDATNIDIVVSAAGRDATNRYCHVGSSSTAAVRCLVPRRGSDIAIGAGVSLRTSALVTPAGEGVANAVGSE